MEIKISQYIRANRIRPADVIVVNKVSGLLDHYLVYVGEDRGVHYFMANMRDGIRLHSEHELYQMASDYQPVRIRRFVGTEQQRQWALNRAWARKDEDSYNLFLNNCEHFANEVQEGKSYSQQSQIAGGIGIGLLLLGLGLALFGGSDDEDENKRTY